MITLSEQSHRRQTGAKQRGCEHASIGLIKEEQNILIALARKEIAEEMEKIARAAGVEMHKSARIVLRRGCFHQQYTGVKTINQTLQKIAKAESRDDVHAQTGIATGYANAMWEMGLMSESELNDIIALIGQEGERALHRIETTKPLFSIR